MDAHENVHRIALGILLAQKPEWFECTDGTRRVLCDTDQMVKVSGDPNEEQDAWTTMKAAHRRAFDFLGGQSIIPRKRTARPAWRVALKTHDTDEPRAKQPKITYAPENNEEVAGWYYKANEEVA